MKKSVSLIFLLGMIFEGSLLVRRRHATAYPNEQIFRCWCARSRMCRTLPSFSTFITSCTTFCQIRTQNDRFIALQFNGEDYLSNSPAVAHE
ncbi:hypothetical protein CEXT_173401 [Caerostris extrusa]|uniref:Secreted protein n=1 Tax=Caerostris extrusa TaxID=172846 RepID=A0AAV4MW42_CAEEX|nr:hypothetical protein CEXT_173401 [Caerostris extrusa]